MTINTIYNRIHIRYFVFLFVIILSNFVYAQPFTDSNLPIVVINTDVNPATGQPLVIADAQRVLATMRIIRRPDGTRNFLTDINTSTFLNYNGRINIETRGSTSQNLPKKPYGLTTLLANNTSNNNVSLLGMPSENDWILNSLAYDNSYIRDFFLYNLSNQLGNYAPKTVYCELVVNGDYRGLYMLQEKLKSDTNRINILKIEPTDITTETITGGYITKADKTTGGDPVAWQMTQFNGGVVNYLHDLPNPFEATTTQTTYIRNQFLDLASKATNNSIQNGFPSVIDVPSFIDFMVINELGSNVDAYQFSTFFHKDRAGKLRAGPVWDLNLTFGNDLFQLGFDRSKTNVWQFNNLDNNGSRFWLDLFNNSTYKCYLSKRWSELNQTGKPLDELNTNLLIDNTILLITEAANRDSAKWFSTNANLAPKVTAIKNFINTRKSWITSNLGSFSPCNNVILPSLVISRIHYNPLAATGFTSNDQEFIEITNAGTSTVSLSGIYLKELGISYQFPFNSTILASEKIYLTSNTLVFTNRYGFAPFGQFTRNLSNKSQNLVLADAFGNEIDKVQYFDSSPWPTTPDGTGPYLQLINLNLDNNLASSWITSTSNLSIDSFKNTINTTIYPNPASNFLTIQSNSLMTKIEILDINGRLLNQFTPNSTEMQIEVNDFQNGMYFVKIYNNENFTTEKFHKN